MSNAFTSDVFYWSESLDESLIRLQLMTPRLYTTSDPLTTEEKMVLKNEIDLVGAYISNLHRAVEREKTERNPFRKLKNLFR